MGRNGKRETWIPIKGFEQYYSVSSLGRVRRECRGPHTQKGKILKPGITTHGYQMVVLHRNNGKGTSFRVHGLVSEAFLGPRPKGLEVHHKNGRRTDNRLCNLEYVTHRQNIRLSVKSDAPDPVLGEAIYAYRVANGLTQADLGKLAGLSPSLICRAENATRSLSVKTKFILSKVVGFSGGQNVAA